MTIKIKAPTLPESVPDGTIATWYKNIGDNVSRDELLVDIETDKVVIEVVSPKDGILKEIIKNSGDTIVSNEAIGALMEGSNDLISGKAKVSLPIKDIESNEEPIVSPAAKKLIEESNLNSEVIEGSGKNGRITKEDVVSHLSAEAPTPSNSSMAGISSGLPISSEGRVEERVPMSRLRATVAKRLLHATQSTAMLTTFNEVNMQPIIDIRTKYKEEFEKSHEGVRLGFMSFFVRASIEALKRYPAVNASLDGNDFVYHGYQDIGVAIGGPRGLVVPVLRNADNMGLAQIEKEISGFGKKAQDGKLSIEEMKGGTFTISNGGVFGSLLSTPILNPPQTAVLGMHKIQERPMAVEGEVKILPIMYLALSYDHQMIDGKEAVQFLVTIKELLEDPTRFLLEI
ncbi:2-oxoglutarate dehydrogenase complex dihydrolipoyllysine-residue succinyltransferase [Gammaproteobacteria bacterium]|nr:2-oxoglutarate dehydrogenase complex dihydrolipoyllysine-residue succinyltransferase [Gammaproteobacteria bacterium]